MAAAVPWRERAFWVTQLLVVCAISLHVVADLYGSDLVHVPDGITLVLAVVPVGYAATRFGLRGSLPTAVWMVVLMLPDIVWLHTSPERWTDGSMLALLVVVAVAAGRTVDVQRSYLASQVTAERLRSMAGLADQLPEGICATDLDGVISYANAAWARMQGLASPQEAVGRSIASFHVSREAGPAGTPYPYEQQQELDPARPVRSLIGHPQADGSGFWAEVTVTPLLDERGRAIGRLSTVQDVTAARTAAAALEAAEERFRVTFERAPLGMALTTPEGRFLQVNDALCQMLGRSAPEVVALGAFGLTYPDDIESTQQLFRQHGTQERWVKRYLHGDGHPVSLQLTRISVTGN
ncbi:MAG: PAS domain-containing protein [Acidimicrobiales bacterium]